MRKLNRGGFTLIEMLVVVAIIGLLSSIVVIGLGGARSKARDAKRLADVQQIINFAEVNYTPSGGYPSIDTSMLRGPLGSETYEYKISEDGQTIKIGACVENNEHKTTDNTKCPTVGASNAGFSCPEDKGRFIYCQSTGDTYTPEPSEEEEEEE
jgi:prepilin-type N-terminal cleavage/methylation domain-containing protein